MHRKAILELVLATAWSVLFATGTGAADEKKAEPAGVEEAFKKFAVAVRDDKFEEVVKWIASPADKVWTSTAAVQSAVAKYEAALDQKFGKSEEPSPLKGLAKVNLAEQYYEARGTIREMKEAGKDRVHVTVWTTRPALGDKTVNAIYERKFTAVKTDGQWKFQLHLPMGGSPVVKKVKRTAADGKAVEVYAEHDPKGGADTKNWEELKPISYEGREEELKREAAGMSRFADVFQTQTEQVQKGAYKTRKEALEGMEKATKEVLKGLK